MKAAMKISPNDKFKCEKLHASLSYRVCVMRQVKKNPQGGPEYPECQDCKFGAQVKEWFKDIAVVDKSEKKEQQKNPSSLRKSKKECVTEGCTSPAQKDGRCYRCYKAKYGKAPYPGMDKHKKKRGAEKVTSSRNNKKIKDNPSTTTGRESRQSLKDNGKYIITVDFSRYPKLHERLIVKAKEEFREPGYQLMAMLHHTLNEMEARA
jgi:hypothetical protein